jgi:hypothetical protein
MKVQIGAAEMPQLAKLNWQSLIDIACWQVAPVSACLAKNCCSLHKSELCPELILHRLGLGMHSAVAPCCAALRLGVAESSCYSYY